MYAEEDVAGFHAFHCSMSNNALKGVYSLSWYGRLLMASGKGGVCSLFSVPEVGALSPGASGPAQRLVHTFRCQGKL